MALNLENRIFRNNKTGESLKVISHFEHIAILENKQKINSNELLDQNKWTEQIDPNSFFNNQAAYNSMVEKIKAIETDNMIDESVTPKFGSEVKPEFEESAIIQTTEEDEIAELAKKYGISNDSSTMDAVQKQNQAFSKYLEEDTNKDENNSKKEIPIRDQSHRENISRVHVEDPIITMFKNVKKTVDFKISFDINDKIPRTDFIEMMEDSYEISIIDFLAEDFTNKILKDPLVIKNKIKQGIIDLISPKKEKTRNTRSNKLPSVKDRISKINEMDNEKSIKLAIKSEKSKSVIKAAEERILKLKK